jgi:hypothetical protein
MIGYAFDSIGLGMMDLILFTFSILAGVWIVTTWRRGTRSWKARLLTFSIAILTLIPFVLLGLALLAVNNNAPAASVTQPDTANTDQRRG